MKNPKSSVVAFLLIVLGILGSFENTLIADDGPLVGRSWENSLRMRFVPAGTDGVLFSIWDVRVKDFRAFADATGYDATEHMSSMTRDGWSEAGDSWKNPGFTQTEDDPVIGMSVNDAQAFCQWLTMKERVEGGLTPKQRYRLPTSAEWTSAVGMDLYPWGNQWPPPPGAGNYAGKEAVDKDWQSGYPFLPDYDDGYPHTSPVGSFKPNAYGLYDMGGDAWQWCNEHDTWVIRGAAWSNSKSTELVSAAAQSKDSNSRFSDFGFRIVLVESTETDGASAPTQPSTFNPFGTLTPSPVPSSTTSPAVHLSQDQARTIVRIKGDNREGAGFLVKMQDGPVVLTNTSIISDNPNLNITTNSGKQVTILSYKGADDRDLAMIAIKDDAFSYATLATNVSDSVQPGDEIITSGNSVVPEMEGKIAGMEVDRIRLDNPISIGNNGGPIFQIKSGKVVGIVTEAINVDLSNGLDNTSYVHRNSASGHSMRYLGLRLDNVPHWESYDLNRFQAETAFLDQFDRRNRALDCYLNAPADNEPQDTLWRKDEKILKANGNYLDLASNVDASQQTDATRGLYSDLSDVVNLDMETIQNSDDFYTFDKQRARDEIAYRKAIKTELDQMDNDPSQLSNLARKK